MYRGDRPRGHAAPHSCDLLADRGARKPRVEHVPVVGHRVAQVCDGEHQVRHEISIASPDAPALRDAHQRLSWQATTPARFRVARAQEREHHDHGLHTQNDEGSCRSATRTACSLLAKQAHCHLAATRMGDAVSGWSRESRRYTPAGTKERATRGVDAAANGDDSVEAVALDRAAHPAAALAPNHRGILGSCFFREIALAAAVLRSVVQAAAERTRSERGQDAWYRWPHPAGDSARFTSALTGGRRSRRHTSSSGGSATIRRRPSRQSRRGSRVG